MAKLFKLHKNLLDKRVWRVGRVDLRVVVIPENVGDGELIVGHPARQVQRGALHYVPLTLTQDLGEGVWIKGDIIRWWLDT